MVIKGNYYSDVGVHGGPGDGVVVVEHLWIFIFRVEIINK